MGTVGWVGLRTHREAAIARSGEYGSGYSSVAIFAPLSRIGASAYGGDGDDVHKVKTVP